MKRYKVICPLINFQIQNVLIGHTEMSSEQVMNFFKERERQLVEGIDLFDGVKIRRLSKEDLDDFKTNPTLPPYIMTLPVNFVLEKYITVENEHDFQLDPILRNVVLALRLLKKSYVSGSSVFYVLVSEKRLLNSRSCEEEPRHEFWGFKYALNFDEFPALKEILEKIQGIDFAKRKSLHLACKRFQRAYEESDAEGQLIDMMIAFEALFLKGEKAVSPAGQIVATACSILLGKNDEEREEIRRFLTKAYSVRNCIVHGSEYQKPIINKEYDIPEFVSKIEDYLRESIKKLLD